MKLQLTLRGGAYGTLELEPIETGDDLPPELREFIESPRLAALHDSTAVGPAEEGRTQNQVYELVVGGSGEDERRFALSGKVKSDDAEASALIDFVWARARPVQSE